MDLLPRFSPGHIQTIPSKYLWKWIAILYICLEPEMLQNIPAMCYIIPLTRVSLNYPICKQDVKRGIRRLRTIFSKPFGGWKLSLWLQDQNLHCFVMYPKILQRRKISTYIHSSKNAAWGREKGCRAQGALLISGKCSGKGYVCSSVSAPNKDPGWNTKVCVSVKRVSSFAQTPASFTLLRWMAQSSLWRGRRKSFHLMMGWLKYLSRPWKMWVSLLSLGIWIHSSPSPAAIGSLWEPQASSLKNNQKFKIPGATEKITEGKVLEQTSTWVSVPRKTTQLVINN